MKLTQLIEQKERPYVVFHAKKGKYETHAVSSYDAAKNAAKHWGLKSTAGITPKLADVEHVAESYDDYHGDMSKKEYDKTVKGSEMEYSVWVGGTEANDNYLSYDEAVRLYDKYKAQGYDDVQLDARIKESVNEDDSFRDRDNFVTAYIAAAEELAGEEFEDGDVDWSPEAMEQMEQDAEDFFAKAEDLLAQTGVEDPRQHGYDFWLTRNGHGVGFWDRGYGEVGDKLTALADKYGSSDMYKGDDGKAYVESINEAEKRWKQTSMSPQEAIAKYGKENVKVKKGALRNGDDMVEVFVESYSPGDEYADSEGMVSNCCGAPMMDYNDGHGRCSDCKDMAAGETEEEYYESWDGIKSAVKKGANALRHGGVKFGKKGVKFSSDLRKPQAVTTKPQMENTYDTKDFEVNPRAGHRDQMAHPENQMGLPGIKTKPKLRPKNLKMKYDINQAVNKAVNEEDEEAIAARDEFLKVMDMKPKSGNKAIDTIKKIVADKQNMQVKFDDGKMKVDLYTASAVSQVYDAVSDENKEKIDNMIKTKVGMMRLIQFAFTKLSEQVQVMENAKKEGRLDEVLPVVPLAIGAARVLGPMAAKALAKKFGKKAVKNAAGKFKPGMNPNSVKTQIKKGAGDGVIKQIIKKSPGLKTSATISGSDILQGGDGTGSTAIDNAYDFVRSGGSSNSSKKTSNSKMSNYARDTVKAWESKEDGENISEYAGKDVVYDKNGKPHDPNSSKGKTIVNMKCNNPNVKDKEGCGTGIDKDKKRRNAALLKKGVGMAKTGAKKLGKAAASSVTATGFANPFESLEAKATKMIEDAVEKTEKMPKIDPTKIKTPTNMKVTSHGKPSTSKDKKMPGDHHPDLKLSAKVLF